MDKDAPNGVRQRRASDADSIQRRASDADSIQRRVSDGAVSTFSSDSSLEKLALKREIGLWGGVSFFVGVMIGSGIFVSPKSVLYYSHSVGLSLTVWGLCGVISLAGALSYAEIALVINKSGGSYIFMKEVYGPEVAFMQMMLTVFLTTPVSSAALALSTADYLLFVFFNDGCAPLPGNVVKTFAIFIICLVTMINALSVKYALKTQIIFTITKLIALGIICLGGIVRLANGYTEHLQNGFEGSNTNPGEIALAFYGGMWAYDGWQMLMLFVEEVKDPKRNVPLAAVISVVLVTCVYLLANVSYFTVMSPQELLDSPAVASTWANTVIPQFAWVMPIFVSMSVFGAFNGSFFNGARCAFIPAREGQMMQLLAMVHVTRYTPAAACIFMGCIGCVFVFLGESVEVLINWFSFSAWLTNGLIMVEIIYMRFAPKWKDKPRPFKTPLICPIFVLFVSIYFVVAPIVAAPDWGYLYALLLLIFSLVIYVPLVKYKKVVPGTDTVTTALQLLLQVAPVFGTTETTQDSKENYTEEKCEEKTKQNTTENYAEEKQQKMNGNARLETSQL